MKNNFYDQITLNNHQDIFSILVLLLPFYSLTKSDILVSLDEIFINNGTNNTFSNLEPAIYNFRVIDACGNIINGIYDVYEVPSIDIVATELCNGQPAMLSVLNYSFLNYEWYKEGNETQILSTSNQLIFSEFDSEIHTGIYYLNISANNASSCMNQTMEFELEFNLPEPNAGEDTSVAFCHLGEQIDLLSLFPNAVRKYSVHRKFSFRNVSL